MIIGHLPRFLILNEMNTINSIASKNCTLNAAAAARKKFDGGLTGQSTTSTPRKWRESVETLMSRDLCCVCRDAVIGPAAAVCSRRLVDQRHHQLQQR